jgi:hypothetical protein
MYSWKSKGERMKTSLWLLALVAGGILGCSANKTNDDGPGKDLVAGEVAEDVAASDGQDDAMAVDTASDSEVIPEAGVLTDGTGDTEAGDTQGGEVQEQCAGICSRVEDCDLFRGVFPRFLGMDYAECTFVCEAALGASEEPGIDYPCIGEAMRTCDKIGALECVTPDLGMCGALCTDEDSTAQQCGLIGAGARFETPQDCHDWCKSLGSGPSGAVGECVELLAKSDFVGFEPPDTCLEMAGAACFPEAPVLPEDAEAFAEALAGKCYEEFADVPLASLLAWHLLGVLQALNLSQTANFAVATECLGALGECPGEAGWLECFMTQHMEDAPALCDGLLACQGQLPMMNDLSYQACLFVWDYNAPLHPDEVAWVGTCVALAEGNCSAVAECLTPPAE